MRATQIKYPLLMVYPQKHTATTKCIAIKLRRTMSCQVRAGSTNADDYYRY
jgi:hypothetical protein